MLTRISRGKALPAGTAAGEADRLGLFFGSRGKIGAGTRGGRRWRQLEGKAACPERELFVGEARGIEGMAVASHPAAVRVTSDHGAAEIEVAVGPADGCRRRPRRTFRRRRENRADHAASADAAGTEIVGAREGAGREAARAPDMPGKRRKLHAAKTAAARAVVAPEMPGAQRTGR